MTHEAFDDAMEDASLEVEGFPRLPLTFFTGTECPEVVAGFRHIVGEELKHNTALLDLANRHVEEYSNHLAIVCCLSHVRCRWFGSFLSLLF